MLRLLIVLFICVPFFAQAQEAPRYHIDPAHTRVLFEVDHLGFTEMPGFFNDIEGVIQFDPNDVLQARVDAIIFARSVNMGHRILNQKLRGPEYFNVARFPTIRFRSQSIQKLSGDRGKIAGVMTMLGVSRPLTLDVVFNKKGVNTYSGAETIGFTATGKLNRSEFGMKTMLPAVGDTISFKITLEAHIETLDMKLAREQRREGRKQAADQEIKPEPAQKEVSTPPEAVTPPAPTAAGATGGMKLSPTPAGQAPAGALTIAPPKAATPAGQPVQLQLPQGR